MQKTKKTKKEFVFKNSLKWLRDLRTKAYEERKKDPVAFEKKQAENARKFRKKYMKNVEILDI